ncbi:MAG TPA: ribonuclease R [Casimicrobiaceae bacterium]|nr:ribonuclease R [Casimicrobiaceae bacterium]
MPNKKKPHEPAKPRKANRNPRDDSSESDRILGWLASVGLPMTADELASSMQVRDRRQFDAAIQSLVRSGDVLVNRKGGLLVADKLDLVRGRLQGHADGYGFVIPDAGGDDVFLNAREMHKALHGDRVAVRVVGVDRRGRPEGEVVEVLERVNHEIVGRLHEERGVLFVEAENRRINQDILIPPQDRGGAAAGEVVVVELVVQPSSTGDPVGRVKEVLGRATDPGIEIEIALRKHALPYKFSTQGVRQAKRLPKDVRDADRKVREDLTAMPLVTIDGETAKDFDDAVYCERKGKGFRLVVAIADVSHYVKDNDALDADARERGNSVYFPRRVIPMLPEELSNELCSLKPNVDRLCMVCDMQISSAGAIRDYTFYPAVMHSKARLTYTAVWEWLAEPKRASTREAKALLPHLDNLYALYKVLANAREKRGAIDFDTVELALVFDDEGRIERIVPSPRNDAHKLIEECMLAANVCTADFLAKHEHPALYRVHEGPPPDKLKALRTFLASSALQLGGGDDPQASDYAKLLSQIEHRPDYPLLQTVLLRSLSQAQYRPDNAGHFGLAFDAYTHFTSPIRRYPDLLVHRAIKACLAGKRYQPEGTTWSELGVHCSMTERRADDATRDVEQWLKCWYMRDRIGESYEGTISGVTGFGLFVTLDGMNVDGLVHISELGRDYFHFDQVRHALIGERGGLVFQLAARIRVKVARVDLDTTKIDFVLDDDESATTEVEPTIAGKRAGRSRPRATRH